MIGRMKPSQILHHNRAAVIEIILRHNVRNPRLFGSCSRGDDESESDIDILVDPTETTTLFDIGAIRHELLQLLGVPVDVVTPEGLSRSLRASVLAEAKPL